MSTPIKARRMILMHSKSGAYNDYTLHPDATEASFAKLAEDNCGRAAILTNVFVIQADSYDAIHERFWNRCLREYDAGRSMAQAVTAGFKEIGITKPKESST